MDEEIKRQFEEELKKLAERFGITSLNLKNFGDAAKKSSTEFKKSLEDLNKEIKKGRAGYADQLRALEQLNDAIEELADTGEEGARKAKLLQDREQLAREAANQALKEAAQEFGKSLTITTTRSTGQFAKQLQVNASGAELSSTIMNAAIEATAGTLNYASKATQGFGRELLNTQGWLSQIGGAVILGLGKAGEFVSESGEKLLKFANEVLSKELEKTEKSFNTVNAAGAVFANGMTGMREASVGAGLTLQQFSNVVSKQSGDLALSGMGVAEGARKVGQVGKIFDANGGYIRRQMQRLGYGFEEQAELTATVMGNMKRAGQSFDTATLAKETQRYAENLRLISAITGEDAKAKAKQVQEQNQIAAFQNELAKMGPEVAAEIDLAMTNMTEIEKKAFRDRVIFHGAVINEEAAIYEATNRAAATKGAELYNKFLNHAFDATAVVEANTRYRDQTLKSFQDNQALFIAGYATSDAALQAVSNGYLEARTRDLKLTKEGIGKVQEDIKKAKLPTDELTEGLITGATAAQNLAIALEDKLLPLLKMYAESTGVMLDGLQKMINAIYGSKGNPDAGAGGFVPTYKPPVGAKPTDLTGLPGDKRTIAEKQKQDADVKAGRKSYNALGFDQPNVDPYEVGAKKGKALGGISTGPVSGYMELLHGTEAVVPLADNRSIPVSLDSSSLTAAMNQQTSVLAEILRAMQNNNNIASQIAMNTV